MLLPLLSTWSARSHHDKSRSPLQKIRDTLHDTRHIYMRMEPISMSPKSPSYSVIQNIRERRSQKRQKVFDNSGLLSWKFSWHSKKQLDLISTAQHRFFDATKVSILVCNRQLTKYPLMRLYRPCPWSLVFTKTFERCQLCSCRLGERTTLHLYPAS
jgi:hypothetical protein